MNTKLSVQTVCYVVDLLNNLILLGLKQVRLGAGKRNGHGGRVEKEESVLEAAKRETKDECGFSPTNIKKYGIVRIFSNASDQVIELHIFLSTKFSGSLLVETDEMSDNRWFPLGCIPYDQMWPSDKFILPKCLKEEKFTGFFHYDAEGKLMRYRLDTARELPEHL